jgi:hypothetical protein
MDVLKKIKKMHKTLNGFVKPHLIPGKNFKPGNYFYCAFPKKYGGPNIGWIEIISIEAWGDCQKMLWFDELKPSPMVIDCEEEYLVRYI